MVLIEVLQLPWTLIELSDSEVMWRSKSRAVGLAVKLGWKSQVLTFDKIVEQALKDEDASLRSYAILVIPLLVLQSSSARLQTFCEVIFNLGDDPATQVREAVAQVIGIMACICNYSTDSSTKDSPPTVQASFLNGSKQFGSAHDRVGFYMS
jgi:hypothetical protein